MRVDAAGAVAAPGPDATINEGIVLLSVPRVYVVLPEQSEQAAASGQVR